MSRQVHTKHATVFFFLASFIEGFFFVPLSTLLVIYSLAKRDRAFIYAIIATVMSVIGGIVGYFAGYLLWDQFGDFFLKYVIKPEHFAYLKHEYETHQAGAVYLLTLMPLPYKAVTISAGFCQIPLLNFILLSILGRGTRFCLLASAVYMWGEKVNEIIDRYFYLIFTISIISFGLLIYFMH